jgi:hypothetical protein
LCEFFFAMEADKYLTKTYKGRFIEHLEQFLIGLDKEYRWVNYHFSFRPTKNKTKFFFCFYCRTTESLILCVVHKLQNSTESLIKVELNQATVYGINERTFVVDAVYSKSVRINEPDFDSVAENFDFLFP